MTFARVDVEQHHIEQIDGQAAADLHDEIRVLVSSTTDRVSAPPNCLTGWVFPSIAVTTFMK